MAGVSTEAPVRRESVFSWKPYQIYVLGLLLLITIVNYLDRGILGVVQEPLKHELKLSDFQLGLLGGPAFGLLYSLAGVPVARLAERMNRGGLLAASLALWSFATALCGAAQNFTHIFLCRLGVGAGEGGCNPISHSLLADTFTVRQRGVVMSVISAAPSLASIIMPFAGGLVAQLYGWRAAFVAVGVPGMFLAVLALLTLRDPRAREHAESKGKAHSSFTADVTWLMRNRAFVLVFIGGAFIGMGVYGTGLFEMSFIIRSYGLTLTEASGIRSITGLASIAGIVAGGVAADRFADSRGRSYVLVPAVGALLTFIANEVTYTVRYWPVVVIFLFVGNFTYALKNGPMYASIQNMAPAHMRATSTAVFMIAASVLGSVVGAPVAGFLSDFFASQHFPAVLGDIKAICPGGRALPHAAPALAAACKAATAEGLRGALQVVSFSFLIASVFLVVAARTVQIAEPELPEAKA